MGAASTAIYYMITETSFSILHRVKSDEVWHFYLGDPVEMFLIYPNGTDKIVTLGNDILNGEQPQFVVFKDVWQGAKIMDTEYNIYGYSLFGTTVSPGFEYEDFELGDRDLLIAKYPDLEELIVKYTTD